MEQDVNAATLSYHWYTLWRQEYGFSNWHVDNQDHVSMGAQGYFRISLFFFFFFKSTCCIQRSCKSLQETCPFWCALCEESGCFAENNATSLLMQLVRMQSVSHQRSFTKANS